MATKPSKDAIAQLSYSATSPDPKGWGPIRTAWSNYQHEHRSGYALENVRDFLAITLADLKNEPDRLSPEAYIRFFDTMSAQVPWKELGVYYHEVALPVLVQVGVLANRSNNEISKTGRAASLQWLAQVKLGMESLMHLNDPELPMQSALKTILDSELPTEYKLRVSKSSGAWLWMMPDILPHVKTLLPTEEKEAFKYFPWAKTGKYNKQLFEALFPVTYQIIELSLTDAAWDDRTIVVEALKAMGKKPKASATIELPSDFTSELGL